MNEAAAQPSTERVHAGFLRRYAAGAVDLAIAGALYSVIFFIAIERDPEILNTIDLEVWTVLAFFPFAILYHGLLEGFTGGTPGKRVAGIRVVDRSGKPVGLFRAFARSVFKVLTVFTGGLGFAIVAFTKQRYAMHDALARTLVVSAGANAAAVALAGKAMRVTLMIPVVGALATGLVVLALPLIGDRYAERLDAYRQATRPLMLEDLGQRSPDEPLKTGVSFRRMQGGMVYGREIIESAPSAGRSEAVGR
jgi:uncharacterized RDD family membrane protein YckC